MQNRGRRKTGGKNIAPTFKKHEARRREKERREKKKIERVEGEKKN